MYHTNFIPENASLVSFLSMNTLKTEKKVFSLFHLAPYMFFGCVFFSKEPLKKLMWNYNREFSFKIPRKPFTKIEPLNIRRSLETLVWVIFHYHHCLSIVHSEEFWSIDVLYLLAILFHHSWWNIISKSVCYIFREKHWTTTIYWFLVYCNFSQLVTNGETFCLLYNAHSSAYLKIWYSRFSTPFYFKADI